MKHPFPDLIDMVMDESEPGWSVNSIQIGEKHKNTNNVAHGAVLYALADTGNGTVLLGGRFAGIAFGIRVRDVARNQLQVLLSGLQAADGGGEC